MDKVQEVESYEPPVGQKKDLSVSEARQDVVPQVEETTARETSSANSTLGDKRTISEWWMIIPTIVIAITAVATGIATGLVFYGQLQEMKAGSADTHALAQAAMTQSSLMTALVKDASDQAVATRSVAERALAQTRATNRLAEAASRQAAIAEEALAFSDRPWIGILPPLSATPASDKRVETTVTIVNSGRSPARVLESVAAVKFYKDFPKNPSYGKVSYISHSVMIPGTPIALTVHLPQLSDSDINEATASGYKLYLYCKVTYQDIRTGRTHHSFGCFYWDPETSKFGFNREYNDAD